MTYTVVFSRSWYDLQGFETFIPKELSEKSVALYFVETFQLGQVT